VIVRRSVISFFVRLGVALIGTRSFVIKVRTWDSGRNVCLRRWLIVFSIAGDPIGGDLHFFAVSPGAGGESSVSSLRILCERHPHDPFWAVRLVYHARFDTSGTCSQDSCRAMGRRWAMRP